MIVSINIYTTVIGEPPRFMATQHPNVYVYVNNSHGDPQNLVLPCPLVETTNVALEWFRYVQDLISADMVPSEMVDQTSGTLTVYNITEGEYASVEGVNYYCVATRFIGKGNYSASVRSRTIKVFYACKTIIYIIIIYVYSKNKWIMLTYNVGCISCTHYLILP